MVPPTASAHTMTADQMERKPSLKLRVLMMTKLMVVIATVKPNIEYLVSSDESARKWIGQTLG